MNLARTDVGNSDKVLVFLHGIQSCRRLFDSFLLRDVFPDFRKISFDLVGFGESKADPSFSFDLTEQAKMVIHSIEALELKKAIFVGHSLGGMVATIFLEMIPNKCAGLISLEGNLTEEDCGESAKVASLTEEQALEFYTNLKSRLKSGNKFEQQRFDWMNGLLPKVFCETSKSIVKISRTKKLLKIFESSDVPRKLIIGQVGGFSSRPNGKNLEIEVIPNATHFMIQENHLETMKAIESFLLKCRSRWSA